jgi:hypothetical protein
VSTTASSRNNSTRGGDEGGDGLVVLRRDPGCQEGVGDLTHMQVVGLKGLVCEGVAVDTCGGVGGVGVKVGVEEGVVFFTMGGGGEVYITEGLKGGSEGGSRVHCSWCRGGGGLELVLAKNFVESVGFGCDAAFDGGPLFKENMVICRGRIVKGGDEISKLINQALFSFEPQSSAGEAVGFGGWRWWL